MALDIIGGYMEALLESYSMAIPLLNVIELFDLVDHNLFYQPLGIDSNSTAFGVSEVACSAIGGVIAGGAGIAAQRERVLKAALDEPLKLFVDSTESMLKQQRRAILNSTIKDVKQVVVEVARKGKGWH